MENMEQRWVEVEKMIEERFSKKPDMEGILFLIGINELDPERLPVIKFSKEQKQDLMHIAVCTLLSQVGYYEPIGRDEEGWPHFKETGAIPVMNMKEQEEILKACIINYFGL